MLRFIFKALFAVICAGLIACSANNVSPRAPLKVQPKLVTDIDPNFIPLKLNQIAVYMLEGDALQEMAPGKAQEFSDLLVKAFNLGTSLEILNSNDPAVVKAVEADLDSNFNKPLLERAAEFGRKLKVQSVLCGKINVYRDSDGTKYGASNPARVQFRLWLLDLAQSKPLWMVSYDSTEQPLSENLLKLKDAVDRKFAYQSAKQLLADGFSIAATSLEDLRLKPSSKK